MRAIDRKVLRDLWLMRGQFLAIAVVIGCGVGVYLGMRSTMHSLLTARASYYAQERFGHIFAGLTRAPERVAEELRALPGVQAVQTRVVADVNLDVPGMVEVVAGRLVSIPDDGRPLVNDLRLRRGRLPRAGRELEVVASEAFVEAHDFTLGARLRAVLDGKNVELQIVGVALSPEYTYSVPPGLLIPDDRLFGVLWLRRSSLAAAFDLEGAFNDVSMSVGRTAPMAELLERVDQILDRYGGLGAISRDDQQSAFFVSNELRQLDTFSYFVPIMFLLVAAFLLNIVLGRMVAGQRTEIAALKAFGYRDREVGLHYTKLVGLVVVIGWVVGVLLGISIGKGMTAMYAEYYRFPDLAFHLRLREALEAVAIAASGAGLGVWGAVRRTVHLAPADALRPEAPPVYQPTIIERLGIARSLPAPVRMIFRELERKPTRALFTGLGVSFATGLTIAMAFSLDSMNLMLNLQYGLSEREDVQLTFARPRDLGIVRELEHLPGVVRAEVFRSVPVKFRAGRRTKKTSLTGVPPDAQLLALLDENRRVVPMPEDGLVLSSKLAGILAVGPGDTLDVEILEGERPHRSIRVARIVDTYVGITAHMSLPALCRVLMEPLTASEARLLVDKSQLPALHRAVKETPLIAGLSARDTVLGRVRAMLDQNLGTFVTMSLGFSLVMAFGVLYNVVRITLAERSRELATLRVLGFRRKEVATILFGEMGTILAIAIPAGLLVGYGLAYLLSRSGGFDTEQFRLPFVIETRTFGMAVINVIVAALVSGWSAWRRLEQFDIVEVLEDEGLMAPSNRRTRNRIIWGTIAVAGIAVIALAMRPTPVVVDLATVTRGTLVVTVEDDGRTRVRERYQVSAPMAGQLVRITLDPGDPVVAYQTAVAEFEPRAVDLLDERSRAEAEAQVAQAGAALEEAKARREQAAAAVQYASSDLDRQKELLATGTGTRLELERAERDETQAREGMVAAEEAVHRAEFERDLARARLIEPASTPRESEGPSGVPTPRRLSLLSPIDGQVLRVFEESARTLAAGTPILELGKIDDLEVVADFLSQDAVRVGPGMRVSLLDWGSDGAGADERRFTGVVRRVEPAGYTKVSTLGVEEQRVDVVIDPAPPEESWSPLGDGFHVQARIVIWEVEDAVLVPNGALFPDGDGWAVYVAENGRAVRHRVEIGRRNRYDAQVLSGLGKGDEVILYPSELITDGASIVRR